jgi:hypothetical protein
MTVDDVAKGRGTWVLLDLPVPLEPVLVDIDRPLEDQLPAGRYLDAAQKMLDEVAA